MLATLWTRWKTFGHWMGDVVARVFLTLFYFIVIPPFSLVVSRASRKTPGKKSGWIPRPASSDSLADGHRSF
jgi:hypothetical protein